MKGYLISIKGVGKRYFFCQNGKQKGKGLDLGPEPPCSKVCIVPLEGGGLVRVMENMHEKSWNSIPSFSIPGKS